MNNQTLKSNRRRPSRAFTLIECLIGLAISAVLLAAIAVALNASIVNYGENEDMFHAINSARQAMARMTSQIRTGSTFDLTDGTNECSFFSSAGVEITYKFVNGKLYLSQGGNDYVLCDNVTNASFTKTLNDAADDYKSVQISLTVKSGDISRTISGAAVVRRNLGS